MNPIPQEGEREALRALLDYVDSVTCVHESTHRGGAIWTICDECGRQWADDENPFTPYQDPPAVAQARAVLAAASSDSSDAYMDWFKKQPSGGNTWMSWQAAVEWVASKPAAPATAGVSDSGAEPVRQLRSVWDVTKSEEYAMNHEQWSAWKAELRAATLANVSDSDVEPTFTAQEIAEGCFQAGISDSAFESLLIELNTRKDEGKA